MDASQWPQQGNGVQSKQGEKRPRPEKEKALKCPRCNCTNTKFCYYNNYCLSQPRYLCKTCRRYWTEGGTLRNVPVGPGGSRKKNKRSLIKKNPIINCSSFPSSDYNYGQDLNLANEYYYNSTNNMNILNPSSLMNIYTGFPNSHNSQELLIKPSLNFLLDGHGNMNGFGSLQLMEGEDHLASSTTINTPPDQNRVLLHGADWSTGMLGGSGSW